VQMANFCVLYFQRAPRSIFQTCILNSHEGHTMCRSMTDIQYAMAENRQGKKERKKKDKKTRMGANAQRDGCLAEIGGALCSTPQSLANAHY